MPMRLVTPVTSHLNATVPPNYSDDSDDDDDDDYIDAGLSLRQQQQQQQQPREDRQVPLEPATR